MKVVSYLRTSSSPYAEGGLSIEAQREYVSRAAFQNGWVVVEEFVDIAAGKMTIETRPEGAKALATCKKLSLPMVVATLDRLSRSPHQISRIVKEVGIDFKVATMAEATTIELELYARLSEFERKFISKLKISEKEPPNVESRIDPELLKTHPHYATLQIGRTKENRQLAAQAVANRVKAFHSDVLPHFQASLEIGSSTLTEVADYLNSKEIRTSRGGLWSSTQVMRAMKAMGLKF